MSSVIRRSSFGSANMSIACKRCACGKCSCTFSISLFLSHTAVPASIWHQHSKFTFSPFSFMPSHCILTRHETLFRLKHMNYKMSVHATATASGGGAACSKRFRSFVQTKSFGIQFQFGLLLQQRFRFFFSIFVSRLWYIK